MAIKKPAGYSGTPLIQKLGIKPGAKVALLHAPNGYEKTLGKLPADVKPSASLTAKAEYQFVQFFTKSRADLEKMLPKLRKNIAHDGMIWVSWPKKSSGVTTDITEDIIRNTALALELVDVKVCAVDETWSGLKLVIPVKLRKS